METSPSASRTPAQPKQRSIAFKIFGVLCALLILLGGAAQMWKGVKQLRGGGGNSPQFSQLLKESDNALVEARRYAGEASPLFKRMMNDVDTLGLDGFRAQQKESATQTIDLLRNSSEQFRLAERKLSESKSLNRNPKLTPFLETKARSYDLLAQTVDINQEMAELVLDESITSVDALLPKLTDATTRYKAVEKDAQAASSEAEELGNKLKGDGKK
jgi:hypothetical protein